MKYTKEQLLGVKFLIGTSEYTISSGGNGDHLIFTYKSGYKYNGYNTKWINDRVGKTVTLLTPINNIEPNHEISNMKYQFKEGDGVTHLTATVEEREKIYKLLKKHKYPSHSEYSSNPHYHYPGANQFQNNFRFNAKGKWVTSSRKQVTNPMTYKQFEQLIQGGEPTYEIY